MIPRPVFIVLFVLLAADSSRAAGSIEFAQQIKPIFAAHCLKCHGETKPQGRLRLDTVAGVEDKLRAKPQLLVAGNPEDSLLYQRLILPADSPRHMPKGADPLPPDEIDLISEWIRQGAVLSAAAPSVPIERSAATKPVAVKPLLPEVTAAPPDAIDKLVAVGATVTPLFAGSNLLEVSFAGRSEPADDDDVALLTDVAEQVYTLNLADAKISAAGIAPLAALRNLNQLHFERSAISDDGLVHISKLGILQYLNLYDTEITDEGIAHLAGLKHLSRLYLWQSKVSYDAAMALEKSIPGLVVNLGFDHPVVARMRLTKELASATAAAEQAQQDLSKAQQAAETSAARVDEIEKQLEALAKPADGT
jgi:Planctomycete cytochrome C/Leucine Rich repeat